MLKFLYLCQKHFFKVNFIFFHSDNFNDVRPRDNELNGKYGKTGLITRTYKQGDTFDVKVQLTAHHKGFFEFKICEITSGSFSCIFI